MVCFNGQISKRIQQLLIPLRISNRPRWPFNSHLYCVFFHGCAVQLDHNLAPHGNFCVSILMCNRPFSEMYLLDLTRFKPQIAPHSPPRRWAETHYSRYSFPDLIYCPTQTHQSIVQWEVTLQLTAISSVFMHNGSKSCQESHRYISGYFFITMLLVGRQTWGLREVPELSLLSSVVPRSFMRHRLRAQVREIYYMDHHRWLSIFFKRCLARDSISFAHNIGSAIFGIAMF